MTLTFKTLSPREFDVHRWTCPLEIGRYMTIDWVEQILTWPLPIYKIWSEFDRWDSIGVSSVEKDWTSMQKIDIQEWSDWRLYTWGKYGTRYSITKTLD